MAAVHMELEQESSEAELTSEDRLSQVASLLAAALLAAAIVRMRPTPSPISGNLSTVSNTCLDVVSETRLNVTRGERSPSRQQTRGI